MTNSSYRTVACKVVLRSLGKSPAKSFVQQLSLWKKYHKHNIEELVIPKRKQLTKEIKFNFVTNTIAFSSTLSTLMLT